MLKLTLVIACLIWPICNISTLPPQDSGRPKIAAEERQALIGLYNAAGGPDWSNKTGWLGPPGTECEWYGVTCNSYSERISRTPPSVISIDLSNNGLSGTISPGLGRLKTLESLSLFGNRLTGILPDSLIQRWLAGQLAIGAESFLFTAVSKVDYEWSASSLLCARRRIVLDSDEKVTVYTTRCRKATPDDRTTYCEVQEGQMAPTEFARLAITIEKEGFFSLQPEYSRSITHSVFENTRVTRNGKTVSVSNYANAGPFELWGIQRAIQGAAAGIEAQTTTELPTCPER